MRQASEAVGPLDYRSQRYAKDPSAETAEKLNESVVSVFTVVEHWVIQ